MTIGAYARACDSASMAIAEPSIEPMMVLRRPKRSAKCPPSIEATRCPPPYAPTASPARNGEKPAFVRYSVSIGRTKEPKRLMKTPPKMIHAGRGRDRIWLVNDEC